MSTGSRFTWWDTEIWLHRSVGDDQEPILRVRKWLAEQYWQERPEALLLTGDMPYVGSKEADWQQFRDETASWACATMSCNCLR